MITFLTITNSILLLLLLTQRWWGRLEIEINTPYAWIAITLWETRERHSGTIIWDWDKEAYT
jgi:hypothetical protein